MAIVSSSHGDPAASRAPVHASTTSSPRWYTAAAAPPPRLCAATLRNACVTPPKSGCTNPEITGHNYPRAAARSQCERVTRCRDGVPAPDWPRRRPRRFDAALERTRHGFPVLGDADGAHDGPGRHAARPLDGAGRLLLREDQDP